MAATARDRDERVLAGPYPTSAFDERLVANWAPDGRSVIFMANQAIWRVNVYGDRNLRTVFQPPRGTFLDDSPSFTPDGEHIVFTRCCHTGHGYSLWMIRADGTHLRNITTEPFANGDGPADTGPQVSPDGKRIAFDRCTTNGCRVTTVSIGGGDRRAVTGPGLDVFEPNWSPDSKRIVFQVNTPTGPRIATINADGTGLRLLTHATNKSVNFDAAFTATGRIIFTHYPSFGGLDLFTMNQAGRDWHRLTNTRDAREDQPQVALAMRSES